MKFDSKILRYEMSNKSNKEFLKEIFDDKYPVLIYRGTKDGMNAATFHKKCDGVPDTLFIAESR